MTQDNMVFCYEGIQRIYRNAVVKHLRLIFTKAFPQDYLEKLRSPFQKEWETIKQNAYLSRNTGELSSPIIDDFDILGVNHFYNLFDKYYDILSPNDIQLEDIEKKRRKQTLLAWIKTIKDMRDPLSHPAEESFSREDAFVLLDSARRVVTRLDLNEESATLQALINQVIGLATYVLREPLEAQLPPRESIVLNFVGRHHELSALWVWLADPHSRRWALAGEGGKGKSALAYNFALDVKAKSPEPFQAIFWLSAKKKRFVEGQIIPNLPEFTNLDDALARILTYFGWLEERNHSLLEKKTRVLELFDEFPCLVIVDDVDTLEGQDESATEFFSFNVPHTKSKVLFTSRRTMMGMGATTTHVSGFTEDEVAEFIESRCKQMGLDRRLFDNSTVQKIVKVTEGSPLFIEDLMRLTTSLNSVRDAIKTWEEKGGNEARKYALGRECENLSSNAKKVLLSACISPSAVSFAELEIVTGLSNDAVSSALGELQRLFLVPKPKLIEGEQRFDVNLNTKSLARDVFGSDDMFRRIEGIYKSISGKLSKFSREDIGAIIRQSIFLQKSGRYIEAENLLNQAIQHYPGEADLYGVIGRLYKSWKPARVVDARENFRRAWQLKASKPEMYDNWCYMEIEEQEWTKAADAAERGIRILGDNKKLLYLAGYSRSRLARDLFKSFQADKAHREILEAIKHLEKSISIANNYDARERALNALTYRSLVLSYEMLEDTRKVDYYFNDWFAEHPEDINASSEWERISRKVNLTSRPPRTEY